jgi:hypothetical protein
MFEQRALRREVAPTYRCEMTAGRRMIRRRNARSISISTDNPMRRAIGSLPR